MLSDTRDGMFDIVLAESLYRLSRDQENVAGLYKLLQFKRIQLVTVGEGLVSELHIGLKGTMNALFIKDLAAKTRRGMRAGLKLAGRRAASPSATVYGVSSTPSAKQYAAGGRSFPRKPP